VRGLLDTNAVLYLLGGRLAEALPPGEYLTSVITEMEMLSYPSLIFPVLGINGTENRVKNVGHLTRQLGFTNQTPTGRLWPHEPRMFVQCLGRLSLRPGVCGQVESDPG
jgi:hypothetical protein